MHEVGERCVVHLGRALGLTKGLMVVSLFFYQKFTNQGCLSPKPNKGFGKQTGWKGKEGGNLKALSPFLLLQS